MINKHLLQQEIEYYKKHYFLKCEAADAWLDEAETAKETIERQRQEIERLEAQIFPEAGLRIQQLEDEIERLKKTLDMYKEYGS